MNTSWCVSKPDLLYRNHHRPRTGRPRKVPRLKAKSPSASSVEDLLGHSPILRAIPWEPFHVKDTDKGPMVWEAKAAPFYLKRDGLPTRPHWLIIARNRLNPDEVKFFVSNTPQSTPLEVMLHVAFSRWHVERCFQDEKDKLGLSHFEVCNCVSLRRHWTITAVSHLFLANTSSGGGEKTELTVCQLRLATSALIQSWWLRGGTKTRLLEHTAGIIQLRQQRNAASRVSHRRTRLRRLNEMGIDLSRLRSCIPYE